MLRDEGLFLSVVFKTSFYYIKIRSPPPPWTTYSIGVKCHCLSVRMKKTLPEMSDAVRKRNVILRYKQSGAVVNHIMTSSVTMTLTVTKDSLILNKTSQKKH